MENVKKFNQLFENTEENVFDEKSYKNEYSVNIEVLKADFLDLLKIWCRENDIEPEKKSINEMLDEYYSHVLFPSSDQLYIFFEDNDKEDYEEYFHDYLEKINDKNYLKWKRRKEFNL